MCTVRQEIHKGHLVNQNLLSNLKVLNQDKHLLKK